MDETTRVEEVVRRRRDRRIVSDWVGADSLGLLVQLGLVPDPWN